MSDASPYQDGVAPGQMPSNGGVTQRSHPNPSKRVRLDLGPDDDGLESEQTTPVEGPAQHVVAISREEKGLLPIASVFRVDVVKIAHNWQKPWLPSEQHGSSGSGFAVQFSYKGEQRLGVVTNAHVVKDGAVIKLIRLDSTKKYTAKVLCDAVDIDLALLEVEDKGFWDLVSPIELGPALPELFTDVMVVGFPRGGRQVCMTKGVVSRVTSKGFAIDHFPSPSQLAIQIDAAINPGNSGGPALYLSRDDGNPSAKPVCLGVATQKDTGIATDNIGFLVPAGTVRRFLQDVSEHGHFRGVPSPGFLWTSLENVVLRKRHSLDPDTNEGVLVTGIQTYAEGSVATDLLKGDVIVAIDGAPVLSEGDVFISRNGRAAAKGKIDPAGAAFGTAYQVKLDVLFSERRDGERVRLKVLRKIEEDQSDEEKLVHPIALGTKVLRRPASRWRWEPQVTDGGCTVNGEPREVSVIKVQREVIEGEPEGALPRYRYDVLEEEKGLVYEQVSETELLPWRPWHAGKIQRRELELDVTIRRLPVMQSVRQHQPGATLSYLMFGGLVFINEVWVPFSSSKSGRIKYPKIIFQPRIDDKDQLVSIAAIYQHDCNFGYKQIRHGGRVLRVNGEHIKCLAQLKQVIDSVSEGFLEVVTENGKLCLDVDECRKAEPELLTICNMRAAHSADLA